MLSQQTPQQNHAILSLMKQSKIYWQVKTQVLNQLNKNSKNSLWQPSLQEILKGLISTDNQSKITGLILNCLQKSTKRLPLQQDPTPQIQFYRQKWSQLISKQFSNIATKIVREEEYDEQDESVNYTYDCSSMLQFLSSLKIRNAPLLRDSPVLLFQNEMIKVSNYQQIRNKYSFLLSSENLLGGDKDFDLKDRQKKAVKIVDGQNIASQIQNYLLYGAVSTSRVNVYKRYFECFYEYGGKKVDFSLYEKVWKPIIKMDCKQILRDPQYFVFKEQLQKVYKLFICDKQLSQMIRIRQLSPSIQLDKYSPIHHILPCKGFSTYIAPFCYTSTSSQDIYELWREVYSGFLTGLHTISSSPTQGILGLCILFEELLYSTQKKILQKFESLNIQPLKIVFPWIFYCMIGYLQVEQFFLLMDRIIGTKSLQLLPLYCLAILFKVKTQILQAKNEMQIIECLVDQMRDDIWLQTLRDFFKYHL